MNTIESVRHPRLPRSFYRRGAVSLARHLLGQKLVHIVEGVRLAGIIVEVEAYLGVRDKAAHTYRGRHTPRNHAMWCDGGHAYVYFTYGMHHCMNVVASVEGEPVAVLVRALEPVEGLELMYRNRGLAPTAPPTSLCSGPGKLCQAMGITRAMTGRDMVVDETLFIERRRARPLPASRIVVTKRIGVAYAEEWADKPLRFYIRDNPHVSKR